MYRGSSSVLSGVASVSQIDEPTSDRLKLIGTWETK
jgi:hypothetical protein